MKPFKVNNQCKDILIAILLILAFAAMVTVNTSRMVDSSFCNVLSNEQWLLVFLFSVIVINVFGLKRIIKSHDAKINEPVEVFRYDYILDIIYKQVHITKDKIKTEGLENDIQKFISYYHCQDTSFIETNFAILEDTHLRIYKDIMKILAHEMNVAFQFINRSSFDLKSQQSLSMILPNNVHPELLNSIMVFNEKFTVFKKSEFFVYLDRCYKIDMQNDVKQVMKYLFLTS